MGGTVIRVHQRDKLKLKTLSKAIGKRSIAATLSEVLQFVDTRRDDFLSRGKERKEEPMLALLRRHANFGKGEIKKVDEYLYGG